MSTPQDPYGDQGGPPPGPPPEPPPPPYGVPPGAAGPGGAGPGQSAPGQPAPGYPASPQQSYQGYVAPKKGLDLERLMMTGAWVVLGLYVLNYLYGLTQTDQYTGDFGDRFFGGMPTLGTGVFYTGVLLAVAAWLHTRRVVD
jgi:hypothetical protein